MGLPTLDADAIRYERFFQTSGDLLCVLDPAGRFVRANEAFREVLGYPENALIGEAFVSIVDQDDGAMVRAFLESEESDGALRVSVSCLHRDLSHRRLSFSLRRVAGEAAIYGTGREVIQQESSNAARRLSELLLKTQATARVGGWEVDCRTSTLYWTDETYRIHEVPAGFTPDLKTAIAFYAPESVPVITAAVTACLEEGKAYNLELQLLTATGRRLWVRAAGQPVLEDGQVVRLIGAFQDINDFKRREIELQEKLTIIEEQRSAIHALSAPIIQVWDGVLALPVVGTLDEERAEELTCRMLDAVVAHRARYAILDLTGVETVDEKTAVHLGKIIRAIQLLGAQSIVTGIRPAMARTLIGLGAEFGGARTVSNLREAIKLAMRDARAAG